MQFLRPLARSGATLGFAVLVHFVRFVRSVCFVRRDVGGRAVKQRDSRLRQRTRDVCP
ncbi:hypothetical protein QMA10_06090 [Arthrobacter sp. APC 3897]|uniref:hypothetical protein n=1 Tax=Arthrobacter sp. APC 3897 TaxID=3035204 RepID=UPI0025B2C297|nr:hypothetical protein [Arthrobacter sp. APC 3897]MDN3481491.1 hypothetical protein [Arthrobacter sp. APC 3897]